MSGYTKQFGCNATTKEGFSCKFVPNREGLQMFSFGLSSYSNKFGISAINNIMIRSGNTHQTIAGNKTDADEDAALTVDNANSRTGVL